MATSSHVVCAHLLLFKWCLKGHPSWIDSLQVLQRIARYVARISAMCWSIYCVLQKVDFHCYFRWLREGKWVIFMFRWGHQVFLGWWAVCLNFEPDFGKHVSFPQAWLWLLPLKYPGRFIVSLRSYFTLLIPSRSWTVRLWKVTFPIGKDRLPTTKFSGANLLLNLGDVDWFVLGPPLGILCFPSEPRGCGFLVDFCIAAKVGSKEIWRRTSGSSAVFRALGLVQQKGWQRGGSPGVVQPVFVQMIYLDVNRCCFSIWDTIDTSYCTT